MERDQLSWAYREYGAMGSSPGGHWAGITEVWALTSAMPGSLSPVKAQSRGPRWQVGQGYLSRDWDTELTSELSLGHPFRASKAVLGLWGILDRQDFPPGTGFLTNSYDASGIGFEASLLPIRIIS